MKTLNTPQNSPAWHAARAQHFCASEAPAMLGVSKFSARSELLRQKSTGISPEVDPAKQRLFDAGHQAELLARPIAESIIGQDLFALVGVREVNGLPLLASFDGIVMDESIVWETKLWNESLAQACASGELEPHYWAQLEHQLIVSQADTALFTTSDGTPERTAQCWYKSVPERRQQVLQGWSQFAEDLASYTPTEVAIKPAANATEALPAVSVQVSGAIAIRDNLPAFEVALRDFIDNRLIRNPETDQDFADLESQIKALKNAEVALDAAEAQMLSQVESVDSAKRMKDMLHKLTRDNRLMAEKLLAARKDSIRAEIVSDGRNALADHMTALTARIGAALMPAVPVDFAAAIKGRRTLDSMRDAVSVELARAKIAANEIADRISFNLRALDANKDLAFLFNDRASIVLKHPEDLQMLVKVRIDEHKAKETARMEAERARIEQQERVKAEAAAQARADAEIAAATALAKQEAARASAEAIAKAQAEQPKPMPAPVSIVPVAIESVAPMFLHGNLPVSQAQFDKTYPVKADAMSPPTLRLGQIADRLGFVLKADFLKQLGFEPAGQDRAAVLFHEADFPPICRALIEHIETACEMQAA